MEEIRVLMTETDEKVIKKVSQVFAEYSISCVFLARNGAKLVNKIIDVLPHFVVMDFYMSQMDSCDVISCVKSKAPIRLPEFVVVSGYVNEGLEKEAITSGASCLLSRPYDSHELSKIILDGYTRFKNNNSTQHITQENRLEIEVTELLHTIGVPAHIKGYYYLRSSIVLCVNIPNIINTMTRQLYPNVAEIYATTAPRVERAIRHAIEVAWDRGNINVLNNLFGSTIQDSKGKPTNTEFIAMISDKIRLSYKYDSPHVFANKI
ncbi:MAG: sporulation transcription factor Spo0A [Candidatus Improbicoccus devescovinae]|nr:MAG: sporulation transcription factor Spo0A [Candidatus Improbicoccus devescovinae]